MEAAGSSNRAVGGENRQLAVGRVGVALDQGSGRVAEPGKEKVSGTKRLFAETVPDTFSSSQRNLLGENPDPDLVRKLSNEKQVTGKNPPTIIWHTGDDAVVAVENSIAFCSALHQAGVPAELHVYKTGRHGLGLATASGGAAHWPEQAAEWLRGHGWLPAR